MKTRWIIPLVAVALLAIASIAIAARSGDDKKATKGTNLSVVKCPLEPTGKTVGGVAEYRPAKDAFDTAELVGLKLADARKTASAEPLRHRSSPSRTVRVSRCRSSSTRS